MIGRLKVAGPVNSYPHSRGRQRSRPRGSTSQTRRYDPPIGRLVEHIRGYYEALDSGDPERVASFFTPDATHYYTRLGPHVGAHAIGEHTRLAVEKLEGRWSIENAIEQGDQACIEWTMTWRDPKSGEPRLDRGTEWFVFRDGLIAEVRAYHHSDERNRSGDLIGFDHAGRGYTVL